MYAWCVAVRQVSTAITAAVRTAELVVNHSAALRAHIITRRDGYLQNHKTETFKITKIYGTDRFPFKVLRLV